MYNVSHIGIIVKDVDRSVDFYSKVLGSEVIDSYQDEKIKIAFLKSGEGVLELIQHLNTDSQGCTGIVEHLAFDVEDVDKAVEKARGQGVKMLFDTPKLALGGQKKIMFFEGPDGEKLEFIQDMK